VLDANWTRDHMVPSRQLYPHQWSWDAAFVAIGLAYVNPQRGWADLRHLFKAQWPDGRVPHIVFNPEVAEADYFPGPAFWNVPGRASTGIVQPPLHAIAAWEVFRRATGHGAAAVFTARQELTWLYPRLVAQQAYLTGPRDLGGGGLASIVHPWESGSATARRGMRRWRASPPTWRFSTGIRGATCVWRTPRTGPPTSTPRCRHGRD
jgi:hypothetical protein